MRRHRIRRLVLLVFLFVVALFPQGVRPAVAAPRVTGVTVSSDVILEAPTRSSGALTREAGAPSEDGTGSTGEPTLLYSSPTIGAGQLFDRVGLRWTAPGLAEDAVFPEYRTSADGTAWSAWESMFEAHDIEDLDTGTHYVNPQPAVDGARFAQYRLWLALGDGAAVSRVGLTFLDVSDLNLSPVARLLNDVRGALTDIGRSYAEAAPVGASRILTRADWAADESRMDWTPRYPKPHTKAVVHHTVTADGGTNVAAEIRSIYHFHAVTRGWGDIGYQYLVDKYGNIWTGRQGGDHVVGGHAFGWNEGAFGVAAIGDYTRRAPTGPLQGAIANIIAMKFVQYGVQPFGNDMFTHQERRTDGTWIDVTSPWPNIQGHRDATYIIGSTGGQTACPGGTIAGMMEGLRRLAQNAVSVGYTNLARIDPDLVRGTYPGSVFAVNTTVTNRGANPIPAGTKVGYQYIDAKTGRVAGAQTHTAPLPTALAPGVSATVPVPFVGPTMGSYLVRWDLQNGAGWWNQIYGTPVREQWLRSADWDAEWLGDDVPRSFMAGETRTVTAMLQNSGGRAWPATGTNPVRLTYKWTSVATGNAFAGATTAPLPQDVQAGRRVTVTFPVTAPLYPTNYTLRLDLEKENEFRFGDRGVAPDDTSIAVLMDYRASYAIGPLPPFDASQTASVPVTITNGGRGTLTTTSANPVALGYHWYDAAGKLVVWDGRRTPLPADLAPGASVMLQAQVDAPAIGGPFTLRFDLAHEGIAWFSSKGLPTGDRTVQVVGPVVRTYAAGFVPSLGSVSVVGTQRTVPVVLTNTSNFVWLASGTKPIALSYHWSRPDRSTVVWDGLRTKLAADLAPGQAVTLQANLGYPSATGSYLLRWDIVEEGVAWFSTKGGASLDQAVTVGLPAFYGGSIDAAAVPASMPTRLVTTVAIRVQNSSSFAWGSDINLSSHLYTSGGELVTWDGLRASLAGMKVNEVRTVQLPVLAPVQPGSYTLRIDVVHEGVTWFSSRGMLIPAKTVRIEVPALSAIYAGATGATTPAGALTTVPISVTNTGTTMWDPAKGFRLAYHLYDAAGKLVAWDGIRTPLPSAVAPGATLALNAAIDATRLPPGAYGVRFDLVQEGVAWFSAQGVATGSVTLTVQ